VPADQRERIFERFVRLGNRGEDDRGSGLGLAICRSIVELHGGRIWSESALGASGLRVVFEIPATHISSVDTAHEASTAGRTSSELAVRS
jgi:signal transduction histidine kinase